MLAIQHSKPFQAAGPTPARYLGDHVEGSPGPHLHFIPTRFFLPHLQMWHISSSYLLQLACVLSRSVVSDSLRPHGLSPARILCLWVLQARTLEWAAATQALLNYYYGVFCLQFVLKSSRISLSSFFFFFLPPPSTQMLPPKQRLKLLPENPGSSSGNGKESTDLRDIILELGFTRVVNQM